MFTVITEPRNIPSLKSPKTINTKDSPPIMMTTKEKIFLKTIGPKSLSSDLKSLLLIFIFY